MLVGMAMLFVAITVLSISSFQGVLKFRKLTKSIRVRATELPLAANLNDSIGDLRVSLFKYQNEKTLSRNRSNLQTSTLFLEDEFFLLERFRSDLIAVEDALKEYRQQLEQGRADANRLADNTGEMETVDRIEIGIAKIRYAYENVNWVFEDQSSMGLSDDLAVLQTDANRLPVFLKERLDAFHDDVRSEYHTWTALSAVLTLVAVVVLALLVYWVRVRLYNPLQQLIQGSRLVAAGDFDHKIELTTKDEVAELAGAMNAMTRRFKQIRDELDHKVQQRTKEVVQSEKLASVGFLAAGVAHEINNPLASIAWSAESLETRMQDLLDEMEPETSEDEALIDDIQEMNSYLQTIQSEAFRCKGITESLLDFSRLGEITKQETDLGELIDGVINMVKHLGKYRDKQIHFKRPPYVIANVNSQEIKQVVLNLITNSLDSLEAGGEVNVELLDEHNHAELVVTDNGCGMSPEVLKHLFEPFFTRRRDGQGTGLGLSITYQIVADHGGTITPYSEGKGKGSRFSVALPLNQDEKKKERELRAA